MESILHELTQWSTQTKEEWIPTLMNMDPRKIKSMERMHFGNHTMIVFLNTQYCSKPRKANRCLPTPLSSLHSSFCFTIWEVIFAWQFDDFMCILQISRCVQCFNLHNGFILWVHMISQSEFLFLETLREMESLTNPIHFEGTAEIFFQSSLCRYMGLLSFQWIISPLCCSIQ